ncbi:hypothetical protein IHE45_06G052100 [Dioscorea alata]|uniref:Uncharacterized protein n=1 Tax=Dioscorea alata TaxID=55571 RepID=A0ACB7VXC9_DIOAL|nr:hypothetical protein IHE45_06G052100 [Dioscorea alata]
MGYFLKGGGKWYLYITKNTTFPFPKHLFSFSQNSSISCVFQTKELSITIFRWQSGKEDYRGGFLVDPLDHPRTLVHCLFLVNSFQNITLFVFLIGRSDLQRNLMVLFIYYCVIFKNCSVD